MKLEMNLLAVAVPLIFGMVSGFSQAAVADEFNNASKGKFKLGLRYRYESVSQDRFGEDARTSHPTVHQVAGLLLRAMKMLSREN